MARVFRLSAWLFATLFFASYFTPSSAQSGILRKQLDADWSPRSESSAFSNPIPQLVPTIDGVRTLIPANSLWIYGGMDDLDQGMNDVWVTTDGARTWLQVQSPLSVTDISRSADCFSHQTGRVYAVSGSLPGSGDQRTSRIVASNDGVNWEVINEDAGFLPRNRPGCAVDSQGYVYMFGGDTRAADGSDLGQINDVWQSRDLGANWVRITARATWVPRISTDTQVHASPVFNKDLIYIESGDGGSRTGTPRGFGFQNDVWVSSDSARSWYQLVANAPLQYRKDAELTIAKNGVMIVTAGDTDDGNANDVWASLDGGYTWGACCTKCGYYPREDHMVLLDATGYLYLMGGDMAIDEDYSAYGNDVWKSTFSFHDVAAVSSYCNVQAPAAGVGLTCFPDGQGGCTSDSPGSAPGSASSTSSGLSGAMIAAIVFGIVVVVLVLFLIYRYKTKAPHEPLLPFFGAKKAADGAQTEQFITGSTGSTGGDQYAQY